MNLSLYFLPASDGWQQKSADHCEANVLVYSINKIAPMAALKYINDLTLFVYS